MIVFAIIFLETSNSRSSTPTVVSITLPIAIVLVVLVVIFVIYRKRRQTSKLSTNVVDTVQTQNGTGALQNNQVCISLR